MTVRVYGIPASQGSKSQNRYGAIVLLESDIQRTITDFLKAEQWRVFHFEDGFDERSKKRRGEPGMPDLLCIRYSGINSVATGIGCGNSAVLSGGSMAQVLWIELKRIVRGRTTKASQAQIDWHRDERVRGALTWIAGIDFPATIEGFLSLYQASGLKIRELYT